MYVIFRFQPSERLHGTRNRWSSARSELRFETSLQYKTWTKAKEILEYHFSNSKLLSLISPRLRLSTNSGRTTNGKRNCLETSPGDILSGMSPQYRHNRLRHRHLKLENVVIIMVSSNKVRRNIAHPTSPPFSSTNFSSSSDFFFYKIKSL